MPNALGVPTAGDFRAIAASIKDARGALAPIPRGDFTERVFDSMARDIAKVLARTNPKFDRKRFLEACGCINL